MKSNTLSSLLSFEFDVRKTTEAACLLLELRGGTMSHLKLIKLLYLMDRESLQRWGRPVTGDSPVSMKHGPVLATTYDLMGIGETDTGTGPTFWGNYISDIGNYEVRLKQPEFPLDDLSEAEIGLIEEIFSRFGKMSRWQLRDFTHTLPEWEDPGQSSNPIPMESLLSLLGKTESDISRIRSEILSAQQIERALKIA
jgi:uncharacterized phage-associated protein